MSRLASRAGLAILVIAVLALPMTAAAADPAPTTLFLNVTTDDVWEFQMAMSYAEKVHGLGHPVVVFLNARAVRWAHRDAPQPVLADSSLMPRDRLAELIERGIQVHVCPSCTQYAGLSTDVWIDGVVAGGPETIAIQMDPGTKVMSY
jgi:predicted peroxiredoxin